MPDHRGVTGGIAFCSVDCRNLAWTELGELLRSRHAVLANARWGIPGPTRIMRQTELDIAVARLQALELVADRFGSVNQTEAQQAQLRLEEAIMWARKSVQVRRAALEG